MGQEERGNKENEISTEIKKEPKKPILKDKTGEILTTKLEAYVEPVRAVKETRGDTRDTNKYNFGDLSVDESDEEEESTPVKETVEEIVVETKKNKKQHHQKKNVVDDQDLDSLLSEFGVEVKVEEKKVVEKKPKKEKKPEEKKKDEENDNE